MRHVIAITLVVCVLASAIVFVFAYLQAAQEEIELTSDLQYRTRLLADSLKETIEPSFVNNSTTTLQRIVDRFANRERLLGVALYDVNGTLLAASSSVPKLASGAGELVALAMDSDAPQAQLIRDGASSLYVFVDPLHQEGRIIGSFMVVQNAAYIDARLQDIWSRSMTRLLIQIALFMLALALLIRYVVYLPLSRMTESIREVRAGKYRGDVQSVVRAGFFSPLASEIMKMTHSLSQARSAASEEARLRLEKLDSAWTAERLKEFTKAFLKDRPIYIVSHVEPFIHTFEGRTIRAAVPAGGVATALSAVMEACSGTWLAYGGGDADKETADAQGKIEVPPEEPKYTLKRVWLTEDDIAGYYRGFANEALWPLSHIAHVRPIFRKDDWITYRDVNNRFAEKLLKEIRGVSQPIILIQDYHFALLPEIVKRARPDAHVGFFWHIPWPSPEVFSICPWRKEILEGVLGADVVGFHTQQYCNNFIETVAKELEARIDFEHFSVTHEEHVSYVKPFPISIAFSDTPAQTISENDSDALEAIGITTPHVILGVDRLDYTKGILERLRGIEFLFEEHPEHRKQCTFLQIASPTREGIQKYQEYGTQVEAEVKRINQKFAVNGWQPIVLERRQYSHQELAPLYRSADICLVTSLHDGMNLVSKEYIASRDDEKGVLVLSQFTGAARDLRKGALVINPYSAEETAEALHRGLTMSIPEQRRRMKIMRHAVKDYNVYRWAAELIKAVANMG